MAYQALFWDDVSVVNKSNFVFKDNVLLYFSTFIISTEKQSILLFNYSWYISLTLRLS